MKIYVFTTILTLLVLTSFVTAQQQPITNFNVVTGFPTTIIGGNLYNITVTYDSLDLDAIYNFTLVSPYPLLNGTPELKNYTIYTNTIKLNSSRIHNNDTVSVYSHYHLANAKGYETIVYFQLAANIKPGNYGLEFNIIVDNVTIPMVKSTYSGSPGRSSRPSITKIVTFKFVPSFRNVTMEPVFDDPDPDHEQGGSEIKEPKPFVNDTKINETEIPDEIGEDNNWIKIVMVIIGMLCIALIVYWNEIRGLVKKKVPKRT